jgi:hypothetical protein
MHCCDAELIVAVTIRNDAEMTWALHATCCQTNICQQCGGPHNRLVRQSCTTKHAHRIFIMADCSIMPLPLQGHQLAASMFRGGSMPQDSGRSGSSAAAVGSRVGGSSRVPGAVTSGLAACGKPQGGGGTGQGAGLPGDDAVLHGGRGSRRQWCRVGLMVLLLVRTCGSCMVCCSLLSQLVCALRWGSALFHLVFEKSMSALAFTPGWWNNYCSWECEWPTHTGTYQVLVAPTPPNSTQHCMRTIHPLLSAEQQVLHMYMYCCSLHMCFLCR